MCIAGCLATAATMNPKVIVAMNGGELDVDESITISSNLVHLADSTIDILSEKCKYFQKIARNHHIHIRPGDHQ